VGCRDGGTAQVVFREKNEVQYNGAYWQQVARLVKMQIFTLIGCMIQVKTNRPKNIPPPDRPPCVEPLNHKRSSLSQNSCSHRLSSLSLDQSQAVLPLRSTALPSLRSYSYLFTPGALSIWRRNVNPKHSLPFDPWVDNLQYLAVLC